MYAIIDAIIKFILGAGKIFMFVAVGIVVLVIIFPFYISWDVSGENAKRPFISDYTVMPGETFRLPKSYRIGCCSKEDLSLKLAPSDVGGVAKPEKGRYTYVNEIDVFLEGTGPQFRGLGGNRPVGYQIPAPKDLIQDSAVAVKDLKKVQYLGTQEFKNSASEDYFYSDDAKKYFHCDRFPPDPIFNNRCEIGFAFDNNLGEQIRFAREQLDDAGLIINGATKILSEAKQNAMKPLEKVKE